MMKVKYIDTVYDCSKALKNGDTATIYLSDGGIVEFCGVSDWSVFSLDGGDWETPEPTQEEQLRADVDFLAAMTGVTL